MVGSAFGLDPLAHQGPDRGVRLWSKTGTSDGVRADVGLVEVDGQRTAYAALGSWRADGEDLRDEILTALRAIGRAILASQRADA
jgi:beta-lactamase class A